MDRADIWKISLLIVMAAAYAATSLLCFVVPSAMSPPSIAGTSLLGPPALLFWGAGLLPVFAGVTVVLFGLLYLGLRIPDARLPALFVAGLVWFLSGYFSAALSI
jgi:hypothetical protein